jgi:hypothetical protein
MFILFAERKVGEQHGPASGAPASDQSVTPVQQGRWLFTEEDVEHVDLIVHDDESRPINVAPLEIDRHHNLPKCGLNSSPAFVAAQENFIIDKWLEILIYR